MRLNARRLSKIWHDRELKPLDKAVYWTERVIRWGHLDPLHSAARDLSFVQVSLLDVAGAFILAIALLVLVVVIILSVILRLIKATFSVKRKDKLH